jgi:hypothetical protein
MYLPSHPNIHIVADAKLAIAATVPTACAALADWSSLPSVSVSFDWLSITFDALTTPERTHRNN